MVEVYKVYKVSFLTSVIALSNMNEQEIKVFDENIPGFYSI